MMIRLNANTWASMPGTPARQSVREMYRELLNRHPLLKNLTLHQQIELPFGNADSNYSTRMHD